VALLPAAATVTKVAAAGTSSRSDSPSPDLTDSDITHLAVWPRLEAVGDSVTYSEQYITQSNQLFTITLHCE
jgi:hypothetical protein